MRARGEWAARRGGSGPRSSRRVGRPGTFVGWGKWLGWGRAGPAGAPCFNQHRPALHAARRRPALRAAGFRRPALRRAGRLDQARRHDHAGRLTGRSWAGPSSPSGVRAHTGRPVRRAGHAPAAESVPAGQPDGSVAARIPSRTGWTAARAWLPACWELGHCPSRPGWRAVRWPDARACGACAWGGRVRDAAVPRFGVRRRSDILSSPHLVVV